MALSDYTNDELLAELARRLATPATEQKPAEPRVILRRWDRELMEDYNSKAPQYDLPMATDQQWYDAAIRSCNAWRRHRTCPQGPRRARWRSGDHFLPSALGTNVLK